MTESIVGIILMACSYFIGCISPATIVAKVSEKRVAEIPELPMY
mgnify:CR=1 FL=1